MSVKKSLSVLLAGLFAASGLIVAAGAPAKAATPAQNTLFSKRLVLDNKTFYPRVKDGYRDKVQFGTTTGSYYNMSATIYNANGKVVRTLPRADFTGWNGRMSNGNLAPVGTYKVTLRAYYDKYSYGDYIKEWVTANRTVKVATGQTTKTFTRIRNGTDTTTRDRSHTSRIYGNGNGRLILDANSFRSPTYGGKNAYATATYRFNVPAKARGLCFETTGYKGKGGRWPGQSIETGKRVNKTTYVVTTKVTNLKIRQVNRVQIWYEARVRI